MKAPETTTDYDVAIIGYGPVGQSLAAMLGAQGHRVVVIERWPALYPLPRAGHIDHEIMRILQSVGVADDIAEDSWQLNGYELVSAGGETLHSFDWGGEGPSGWHSDYSLFQPYLESLLHARVTECQSVDLLRGWQAESLEDLGSHVRIDARLASSAVDGNWVPSEVTRSVTAKYVVGCDGANSIVRHTNALTMTDFGFEADWLVVFIEPSDQDLVVDMPDVAQILDPARPTTAFRSSGKRFCRWEFMIMPGESLEEMSTPEAAWRLVERWGVTAENSTLVRNTVFRFRSLVADQWRAGRCFVAGDAAHLMPPFLGQGMCSGLRDALNLSWKLDLVLRGLSDEALLDSYQTERRDHVVSIVGASLALGSIISVIDPVEASARDERLRDGAAAPPSPLPRLVDGVLLREPDGRPGPDAGELSVQSRISLAGREGRSDDVLGPGWKVYVIGADARTALSRESLDVLERIGAKVVRVGTTLAPHDAAVDLDGTLADWVGQLAGPVGAVIVRPDFYTYGSFGGFVGMDRAVADLAAQLCLDEEVAAGLSGRVMQA